MKRFTGILLALAFLLPGMAYSASEPTPEENLKFRSETVDYRTIKVQLINLQKALTTVTLKDIDGKEYYRKVIKNHNGFARKLDLDGLDNGRYILAVEQNDEKWVQVVLVDDDKIRLSKVVNKG